MSEGHHDLANEFPEYRDRIHELKTSNAHFARLMGEYHDVSKELHAIEAGTETPEDSYVEQRKKVRLALLDEMVAMLRS
ncbi:MAG: DUF465 domain-containing protein [Sandaracinus sp.]|nr:DUF465 domain-containing protein [Myxococcales bacterium]MCB9601103.1 DUF465 domain-containing protein [Sandaracinus sp.]MCB9610880.1 DUF465 domain-containing protein [Sandaracinus sp.]MCB9619448.1 DUF465 domain-containing protein [Sandaracinus sp.]MCB9625263.1 DUF465 domain-containing protein [Sandaracinus sp.]